MKINMYYGGRGIIDDPTLTVLNQMQAVFEELNVTVERFSLFDLKSSITTLPETLKSADGIVLATTIEWFGIGGYMQEFLDACWLYGDKEKISTLYMFPVVMSTTHGEQEGKLALTNAWEILGGQALDGISGYITDTQGFENQRLYRNMVEKKTENLYRAVQQKPICFPSSKRAVSLTISAGKNLDLTPQESEQLSKYIADDVYVQTQKEDIKELSSLFKDYLGFEQKESTEPYIDNFRIAFHPVAGLKVMYSFRIGDREKQMIVAVNGPDLELYYDNGVKADVEIAMTELLMDEIISGRKTFQRSFMAGEMKMKGDFKHLRALDSLFQFQ